MLGSAPFGVIPFGAAPTQDVSAPVEPVPEAQTRTGGSWWSLRDIAVEARQLQSSYRQIGLIACPFDGEVLRMGAPQAPGVRHCTFCGRQYT